MSKRTSFRMSDERARLFEQATDIVRASDHDEPPVSDVIDAALTHLIETRSNIDRAREEGIDPNTVKLLANTSVLNLTYRTNVESVWR